MEGGTPAAVHHSGGQRCGFVTKRAAASAQFAKRHPRANDRHLCNSGAKPRHSESCERKGRCVAEFFRRRHGCRFHVDGTDDAATPHLVLGASRRTRAVSGGLANVDRACDGPTTFGRRQCLARHATARPVGWCFGRAPRLSGASTQCPGASGRRGERAGVGRRHRWCRDLATRERRPWCQPGRCRQPPEQSVDCIVAVAQPRSAT
mmetsp:Transcript_111911/g.321495  ORF Transcript_111911/g.321495 Transcript_111911/m.321495 type:complete len:206 (+) Transcript_111911:343-960(+)